MSIFYLWITAMVADGNAKRAGGPHGVPESEPGEPAVADRLRSGCAASKPNFLTLAAAHAASGLSRDVIRRAVRSGKLAGFIPGRRPSYRIREHDVLRLRMWLEHAVSGASRSSRPHQSKPNASGEGEVPGKAEMRRAGDRLPDFRAPGAMPARADLTVTIPSGKPCGPWLAEIKSPGRAVCVCGHPKTEDLTILDPSEIVPPPAIVWRPAWQAHEGSLWHARRWPEINGLGTLGTIMRNHGWDGPYARPAFPKAVVLAAENGLGLAVRLPHSISHQPFAPGTSDRRDQRARQRRQNAHLRYVLCRRRAPPCTLGSPSAEVEVAAAWPVTSSSDWQPILGRAERKSPQGGNGGRHGPNLPTRRCCRCWLQLSSGCRSFPAR